MYRLRDERVATHSMVAYGAPNKWQKKKHRGRKRCGMLFAMPSVRKILELKVRMTSDPDVRAKRLTVGDPYLEKVLYGTVDTMRNAYPKTPAPSAPAPAPRPSGGILGIFRREDPPAPKPAVRAGFKQPPKSIVELKARGYKKRGAVSKKLTASQIAGGRWNSSDTYYTIRNKVIPGNIINPAKIEVGMAIWMK